MEVRLAKTAGFCFGVKRAVETVYEQVEKNEGKQIYTYGPIIHNDEVVKDLRSKGVEVLNTIEKAILLYAIDEGWKENLRELDELKHSVQNATYEQKDPLLIYKLESSNLFGNMLNEMNRKITSVLMRAQIPVREPEQVRKAEAERRQDYSRYSANKQDMTDIQRAGQRDTRERQVTQPIHAEKTVGRNDACPCGSGKKYKNCCGKNA